MLTIKRLPIMFPIIISRLFEPTLVISVMAIWAARQSGMDESSFLHFIILFVFGMIAPPLVFLAIAVKSKLVNSWDVSDRKQRVWVLLVGSLFILFDFFITQQFFSGAITKLLIIYSIWFVGFFCVTLVKKISGHVGITTLALGILFSRYGWVVMPCMIIIPLLGYARIRLKRHTPGEVVGGFLYSIIIIFLVRYFQLI